MESYCIEGLMEHSILEIDVDDTDTGIKKS